MRQRLERLAMRVATKKREVADELRFALSKGDHARMLACEAELRWLAETHDEVVDLQRSYVKPSELAQVLASMRGGK